MGRLYSGALRDGDRLEAVYPDGTRIELMAGVPDMTGG